MPAMATFTDMMAVTPSIFHKRDNKGWVNEVQKNTYLLNRLLLGKDVKKIVQGGKTILVNRLIDVGGTFSHYSPNDPSNYAMPQVRTNVEFDWRFSRDYGAWTDQQVELNVPEGATDDQRFNVYVKEKEAIQGRMWTSMLNGLDSTLFANAHGAANAAAMEDAGGTVPYPISAFVNENDSTWLPDGWTTVGGVAPGTDTLYRNKVRRYKFLEADDPNGTSSGLLDAFRLMFNDVRWVPPDKAKEYFESSEGKSKFIATSNKGQALYEKVVQEARDDFRSALNVYPGADNPSFKGVDLLYVRELDTATLYLTAASTYVAEDDSTLLADGTAWAAATDWTRGPRYYWIDGDYLYPVFKDGHWFKLMPVQTPFGQPESHVQNVHCWWNLICASRQRQGIVSPGA